MNNASTTLIPETFKKILTIDIVKDKKRSLLVNIVSLIIAVIMIGLYLLIDKMPGGFLSLIGDQFVLKIIVALVGIIFCFFINDLIKLLLLKILGVKDAKFVISSKEVYTTCKHELLKKNAFIFCSLVPVIFWILVIVTVMLFVPSSWTFIVYIILVMHVSGSFGAIYNSFMIMRTPSNSLIHDKGLLIDAYSDKEIVVKEKKDELDEE